jgi:hypothetical protein
MDSSAQPLDGLRAFRKSLYRCFDRRADALFELTDALLTNYLKRDRRCWRRYHSRMQATLISPR